MNGLRIEDIYQSYGEKAAVRGVSFSVPQGETVALLGPSGCGKSTLLYLIAGLEPPDRGRVLWDEVDLASAPPHRRGFGLMFQDFALFPHRNVFDNVAFGLRMKRTPAAQAQARVSEVLELVGLGGFGGRDVNTLSGGEQQRVALARALAPGPRLLMFDEPLGSLDRSLRERLVEDLHAILQASRQTAIYVTHDQEEAFVLADRVVLLNAGQVEQDDTPQRIFRQPASPFVARFLGLDNLLPGVVQAGPDGAVIETALGALPFPRSYAPLPAGTNVTVLLRTDAARLDGAGPLQLDATLLSSSFRGSQWRVLVNARDVSLRFDFPAFIELPEPGAPVHLSFDPQEAVEVFAS